MNKIIPVLGIFAWLTSCSSKNYEFEDTEFRSLHAWDARHALVFDVSPQGRAFMTRDGGLSWEQVYQSPVEGAFFNSLKFANDQEGMAISDPIDDRIFVIGTNNGGQHWEFVETPVMTGESAGLFSVSFSNANTGVAVGGDFNQPDREVIRAICTEDGGKSWQEAYTMPAAYRSCVVSLTDKLFLPLEKPVATIPQTTARTGRSLIPQATMLPMP